MYCDFCGKEIKDDVRFCPFCGASFGSGEEKKPNDNKVVNHQESNPVTRPKKRIKKKMIAILIVVVLAVCACGGAVTVFASPAYQMSKNLKEEDYDNALSIYNTDVKDSSIQIWIANQLLSGAVSDIVEKYEGDSVNYEEAMEYLEALKKMAALDASEMAAVQIENLETLYASEQAYELGESYYAAGEYDSALNAYQQVVESDTEHYEDAQNKIQSATENYREQIIEKVGSPSTVEDYETAISLLNTALSVLPDDEELISLLDTCETELMEVVKESALTEATDAIAEGNYETAFEVLETALTYVPEDTDLLNLVSSAQGQYEDYITAEVEEFLNDEDYTSALNVTSQALKILPDNKTLLALKETVEKAQPKYLLTVCPPYQTVAYTDDQAFSLAGNSYMNGFSLDDNGGGCAYFNLNGQYTMLSFDVGHIDDYDMETGYYYFYLDGQLVYTLTLDPDMMVEHVEIPLNSATQLVIKGGEWSWCFALVNVMVTEG